MGARKLITRLSRMARGVEYAGYLLLVPYIALRVTAIMHIAVYPSWLFVCLPAAVLLCLVWGSSHRESLKHTLLRGSVVVLVSFSLAGNMLLHGRHFARGEDLYDSGRHEEALAELHTETETWRIFLLGRNTSEFSAFSLIAKAQSQLEDFDAALDTYRLMEVRFRNDREKRAYAQKRLERLDTALDKIRRYENPDAELDPEEQKLVFPLSATPRPLSEEELRLQVVDSRFLVFARLYQHAVGCDRRAVETYERILQTELPESAKEFAREKLRNYVSSDV